MLCQCGCGEEIRSKSKNRGEPMRFKLGHNRRGIIGSNHQRWKGGKYIHPSGYEMVLRKGHPRADKDGYVYGHILVYEDHYNCCVLTCSIIHHKNGIKNDNRIRNLKPMTASRHQSYHRLEELSEGKVLFGGKNRWGHIITPM